MDKKKPREKDKVPHDVADGAGHEKSLRAALFFLVALCLCAPFAAAAPTGSAPPVTNNFITHPISLADAVNLALQRNPDILRAQKDLASAQGIVAQTRAIAVPKVAATGSYSAVEKTDVDIFSEPARGPVPAINFGNDNNWVSQLKLVQSLYEGGRILSAMRAARLTRERALLNYDTTVADTVLNVQVAYDDVLLARQQITVQEASVELLTRELDDSRQRFDAGTVPRFNVLRADVELANERPKLIHARNDFRIAKNNLANVLGLDVPHNTLEDIPFNLTGRLEAEPWKIGLPTAIGMALDRRSELAALRKAQALRQEDVVTAKAGNKPSVQAYGGYDVHNTMLSSDLGIVDHGWIAGVQVSWNIFDGLRTRGLIEQTRAEYERAGVDVADTGRRIELEVRTAYSNFLEADETMKSQETVVAEAEEALRLATARSDAGTGTQLDVLSAQTALTQARVTQIQAVHDYAVARARLERAAGLTVPAPASTHP
jgi:outer membrane protein TolC